jgi:DNA repair protein RAD50
MVSFFATRYTKALDSIKALRKDRVAELKAEKVRLEGLATEKANSDKLKRRISDLNATIAAKEVKYEETKKQYEALVISNTKLYDMASKFREMYMAVKMLEEKLQRYKDDLAIAKENVQAIEGRRQLLPC